MFVEAHDVTTGLAVWLFSGSTNSDADYEAYLVAIAETASITTATWPAALQVVDDGNPTPSPHWRRRIAEASMGLPPERLFGLVTTSALVRGVVVAINWIRPPRFLVASHATFEAGVAWVETHRGPSAQLFALHAAARAKLPAAR